MLVRVQMVREIGLLDENMRFICSDADYSFTARARGWRVLCAPAAQTQHALDASGQQSDAWLSQIKLQDHVFFAHKWLTGGVYRQLALEGPELTPEAVQKELAQSQATLQYLTEQIRQKKQ